MDTIRKGILVVDDEQNIVLALKRELHEWAKGNNLEIYAADSAKAGLIFLEKHAYEIVLIISDLRMPEMLGSDFLISVKDKYPDIVTILLTGYLEPDEITKAVSADIFGFMLKPWDHTYLVAEIQKAYSHYVTLIENKTLHERLVDEIRMAGELQRSILRPTVPASPRIELRSSYKPIEGIFCSTNYYDVITLSQTKFLILMGDVDSFGVRAALITTMLKAIIQPEYVIINALKGIHPSEFLDWLNHRVYKDFKGAEDIEISLFAGILDLTEMSLMYANAGHTHPILFHAGTISELPVSSSALGTSLSTYYTTNTFSLTKGDFLLFYSFGLLQQNEGKRLTDILTNVPLGNNFQQRLLEAVLTISGEKKFHKDVSLLTAQLN